MNQTDIQQSDRLLSSWKEIAMCLNRGVRTVQRWEQFGMPVQRPAGAGSNVVLAVESDLLRWASRWKKNGRLTNERANEIVQQGSELEDYANRLNAIKEQIARIDSRLTELEIRLENLKPAEALRLAS